MYELTQVGERTYYIECPAKMGLYRINDEEVCLIDSGNDKDAGKKALKVIEGQGWKLSMIINTHFHADHIGGNQLLQQRTGCKICGMGSDLAFTAHPILEPALLFGAYPPKVLRGKTFMAKESDVAELTDAVLPEGLSLIMLPGHSDGQFGIRTCDDVVFLADCLMGENILNKYRISFIYNVRTYLETLDMVKTIKAKCFVPAHAEATEDIVPLADANIRNTLAIMDDLLSMCREPKPFEDIMAEVFALYDLPLDPGQYFLNGATIKAMLSYLSDEEKLLMEAADNRIWWRQA